MMNRREVLEQISVLVQQAQDLVYQAEALADEHNVGFSMNLGGYGMGGYYVPVGEVDDYDKDEYGLEDGQSFWRASSQSC